MRLRNNRRYNQVTKLLLTAIIFLFCSNSILTAQSSTQINIIGVPPALTTPFADDIENSFRTGQYQIIFNYTSFTSLPVDFVFDFVLYRNNRPIVDITSAPRAFTPGSYVFTSFFEENQFRETPNDIIAALDSQLRNQVVQSGAMPEGNYTIEITARPFSQQSGITPIPGRTNFSVRYPPPPILVSVPDGANLTFETPTFSWTPVVSSMGGTFEYEFLLVELFEGQTPLQAINSNRAHASETLVGRTTLPYTLEYLPLEEGMEYAWQVRARDVMGNAPLQNDGESEINTFRFRDKGDIEDLMVSLESISLVPNFVELIDLDQVDVEETPTSYILNGQVSADVNVPGSTEHVIVSAFANRLEIQKSGGQVAVIIGGSVDLNASGFDSMYPNYDQIIRFESVTWDAMTGLTANVAISTPDDKSISADGDVQLTQTDISGVVTARGSPLFSYGNEFVNLELTAISASFPGGNLIANGDFNVYGVDSPCVVSGLNFESSTLASTVSCRNLSSDFTIGDDSIIEVVPSQLVGNFTIDRATEEFDYNVSLQSSLAINLSDDRTCDVNFLTVFDSEEGVEYSPLSQNCNVLDGGIDLGFAKLAMRNVELHSIDYNIEEEEFNFDIEFDTRLSIEEFGGWQSPWFENTRISNDGVSFESQSFVRNSPTLPDFDLMGYTMKLQEFVINEFTFPLFDWDQEGPGAWDIEFSGDIRTPQMQSMPKCFTGVWGTIENGRVTGNRIITDVNLKIPEGCRWEFGAGYALEMNGVEGTVGLNWTMVGGISDIKPFAEILADGNVEGGFPHRCADSLTEEGIQVTIDKGINATFDGLFTDCPIEIGPFEANLTSSLIELEWNDIRGQQGQLNADIELVELDLIEEEGTQDGIMAGKLQPRIKTEINDEIKTKPRAGGSVRYDIINGRLIDAFIYINGPFRFDLPRRETVMTFILGYAEITRDGLLIDGRNQLIIGDETIGATFDNFLIDLETFEIKGGRIIFDENFAFEAGIDGRSLSFNAVPIGYQTKFEPGLYMELGGTVVIDSTGISTSGEANANIKYGDKELDSDLTVDFSNDFRMGLFPFKVQNGKADFLWDGSVFATVDRDGFHPNPMFFADMIIPERLPLPSEQVAYIQLREFDELLIDYEELEDGLYSITTRPDEPLSLVLPVLDSQNPPSVAEVQIIDLVISGDPMNPGVVSGSIIADIDPDHEMYDLTDYGFPLQVNRLIFGDATPDGLGVNSGLYMEGNLNLFDSVLAEMPEVGFYIQNNGDVEAQIFVDGFENAIQLVPGSDRVVYNLNSFYGTLNGNLSNPQPPSFLFELFGNFEVRNEDITVASAILDLKVTENTFNIEHFDAQIEEFPTLSIGQFEIDFKKITGIPELSYSSETGFNFAAALDLDLVFNLSSGDSFSFPVSGFEIGNEGFSIPEQNIHSGAPAGLNLPSFNIYDLEFQPLALRTSSPIDINWLETDWSFDPDFEIDFELHLPEFEGTGLFPPDGLTFNNVGFTNGYLTGSVEAYFPIGGAEIPLGPQSINPPILLVNSIGGALSVEEDDGSFNQNIDIFVDANLTNLPKFSEPDLEACDNSPDLNLNIVQGRGFEGSFEGFVPCGEIELGPISFEALQSDLFFDYRDGQQIVWLDGEIQATLPSSDDESTTVTGSALLNLVTGNIMGGQIAVNTDFQLGLGPDLDNPIFDLALQQAIIDSSGLTITGNGNVEVGDFSSNLTVNVLKLQLPTLSVLSGNAIIESGIAFDVNLSPIEISGAVPGSPIIGENLLRFSVDSAVQIDANGLAFDGTGSAELIHSGESYSNLGLNFEDNFTINFNSFPPNIASGRAEFLLDGSDEPIVIWDTNGFQLGGGLVALLPDRIGLPIESIAYIDLVDEEGNPILQVESTDGGGYTLSTGDQSLPIVIPAISDEGEEPESIMASFSLTTDGQYNIIAGSIEITENLDLESKVNLPVSITGLDIGQTENGVRLQANVLARLPSIFEGSEATGTFIFEHGVGLSGSVMAGQYAEQWSDELDDADPLFSYSLDSETDSEDESSFSVDLYGVEIVFGATSSLKFASSVSSSILTPKVDEAGDQENMIHTLFLSASYDDGTWDGNASFNLAGEGIDFGLAKFIPDDHNSISLEISQDRFVAAFNGTISFEELFDDDFAISVQDLQLGVEGIQSSPALVFGLGEAIAELPDQEFDLLSGTLTGQFSSPQIGISGTTLSLTSTDGSLTFLETSLGYSDFYVSTAGEFSIGNIGTDAFDLFGDYVALDSISVAFEDFKLSVGASFMVQLPEPVAQTAGASVLIKRNEEGTIEIETEGPNFDFEGVYSIADLAEFHLHDAAVNLNISDPLESSLLANGSVFIEKDGDLMEVITFGNPGNTLNEAGISFQPSRRNNPFRFNATGNINFNIEHSFFSIDINANGVANSTQSEFLIILNGNAGLTLAGVSGSIGYEGFTVGASGIVDIGNFSGEGELSLMGFASLGLGQFYHTSEETTITINSSPDDQVDPEEMGSESPTETITVTQLLCFGAFEGIDECGGSGDALTLSLGGDTNSSSGGISGGIEGILFYETTSGDKLFYMNGFSVEVSEVFSMYATVQYESTAPQLGDGSEDSEAGMLLRVAASAQISLGDEAGVGAIVAGKFENRGGLSFGFFAAVRSEGGGIPIVPGVVELTGVGGGFFYRPKQEDLTFISNLIESQTSHDLQGDPGGGGEQGGDLKFAAMLYAEVGIAGAGGISVIQGSSYVEVTNESFYVDVFGTVMGMGGEGSGAPAGLELTAGGFLSMIYQKNDGEITDFLLEGNINFNANIPVILEGSGTLDFFAGRTQATGFLWGIDGYADLNVYGPILSGSASFLASDIGFLFDGGLNVSLNVPIVSFEADLFASIWYVDHPDFSIPFGGYATASIEICVVLCGDAQAVGAFAHRGGNRLNLYAYGEIGKLSGYVSVTNPGPTVDSGSGKGDGVHLIEEAMAQKQKFEEYIDDLRDQLAAAMESLGSLDAPQISVVSSEDAARAGFNLMSLNQARRDMWADIIRTNESADATMPDIFDTVLNNYVEHDIRTINVVSDKMSTWSETYAQFYQLNLGIVADDVIDLLTYALEEAADIEEMAELAYDEFLSVLAQNPVSNIQRVDKANYGKEAPSFQVDESLAEEQAQQVDDIENYLEQLGISLLAPIQNIESIIEDMETLLFDQPKETIQLGEAVEGLGNLIIELSPSVLGFTKMYARAISYTERYYSYLANEQWVNRAWGIGAETEVTLISSSIESAVTTISDRMDNQYLRPEERIRLSNRINILHSLRIGRNPQNYVSVPNPGARSEARTLYEELDSYSSSMYDQVKANNMSFWYDMFVLGLGDFAEQTEENLISIFEARENTVQPLKEAHISLTNSIEDFYDMKANTFSILYGMVDNFVSTLSIHQESLSNELQDELSHYNTQLTTYATMLQPPQITGIIVNPNRSDYNFFNETDLSWNATHPLGVEETSIQIENSAANLGVYHGVDEYRSIGDADNYTLFAVRSSNFGSTTFFLNDPADNMQTYNVGIRVRGPAGTTSTRRGQFTLDVGINGDGVSPGHNAVPQQESQPSRPLIEHSRDYLMNENAFWTNNPQFLRITARSFDRDSGIDQFEYAIGSSYSESDIVDWTLLSGGSLEYLYTGTARISANSRVIDMELDSDYYVSVRATNGAGIVSDERYSTIPIRFDPDPPTDIEKDESLSQVGLISQIEGVFLAYISYGTSVTTYDPIFSSPSPEPSTTMENLQSMLTTNTVPKIAASWTESTDSRSGLAHYEYVVTSTENVTENDFSERGKTTGNTLILISGGPDSDYADLIYNYDNEVYLHVRAVNHAGSLSNMLTYELVPPDRSRPTATAMRVRPTFNETLLHVTYPAADPESGLKGIQYSVGTSPGSTNIRPFPTDGQVDLELDNSHAQSVLNFLQSYSYTTYSSLDFLFPNITINNSDLPKDQELYFNFRSVNNQNMLSAIRATGPIVITDSPPQAPQLSSTFNSSSVQLNVDNIYDPVAGVVRIDIKWYNRETGEPLSGWIGFHVYNEPQFTNRSLSKTLNLPSGRTQSNTNIHVRVVNLYNKARMGELFSGPEVTLTQFQMMQLQ